MIEDVVGGRGFAFSVERAIFATVLHRLFALNALTPKYVEGTAAQIAAA